MAPATSRVRLGTLGTACGCATLVGACVNMSGFDASSDFQCKAPEGIPCQSVSGVYANDVAGTLASMRRSHASSASSPAPARIAGPAPGLAGSDSAVPELGALRSQPTVIRIWIAPWEDADGDLNEESRVYLQIDNGRWLIEHNRERIRQEFAPPMPLPQLSSSAAAASAPTSTQLAPALSRATAVAPSSVVRPSLPAVTSQPAHVPLILAPATASSQGSQR